MKLRTRIILICSVALLAAAMLTEAIIIGFTVRSRKNEAFIKAYQSSYSFYRDFEQEVGNLNETDENRFRNLALNYFKKTADLYVICVDVTGGTDESKIEYFYNHTIFTYTDMRALKLTGYDENIYYSYYEWHGQEYIIFEQSYKLCGRDIEIYRFVDISYLRGEIEGLILMSIVVTFFVCTLGILILSIVIKKVLKPLQTLNAAANQIAENDYQTRIEIKHHDEVGQLGENFNKMAEAVEARTKSLEESEKRKTLFMGNLTHEIKTPMTAISGYSQTLLTTKLDEEDQQEALMYIYKECGRLERLSRKMMRLLELDQNMEIELRDTPVSKLFEAAGDSCSELIKKSDIQLEFNEQGEHFRMDIDLMTDVLINLIDNAVKASRQGSRIIVLANNDTISVQDFGKGIPEDEIKKILEPFYMIDKSRSRKSGGSGLGLALTAMIVKKHNIKMTIDSKINEGTVINLQFV